MFLIYPQLKAGKLSGEFNREICRLQRRWMQIEFAIAACSTPLELVTRRP